MYKLICIATDYFFFLKKNLNNIYLIKCANHKIITNHKIVYLLDFFAFIFFFLSFLTIFIFTSTLNIYKSHFFFFTKLNRRWTIDIS